MPEDEDNEEADDDTASKKQEKEELLDEVAGLLPRKMGDSYAVKRLEGIDLIEALPPKLHKRLCRSNKLISGLPNMNPQSDAIKMVEEAGYDNVAVRQSKAEARTMKADANVMRQEVNAAVLTSNDCLRVLALLEKSNKAGDLDRKLKRVMEHRAMTNVMIQCQRLVQVGADLTKHLTQGLNVTSAAPKLRQLITDTKPMNSTDRAELTTELVNLGKLSQAATDSRKRKYDNTNNHSGGRGGYNNRSYGSSGYSNYNHGNNNYNNRNNKGGGKRNKGGKGSWGDASRNNNNSNNSNDGRDRR